MDGSPGVIHQQQVIGCVITETDHSQRSVSQFSFFDGFFGVGIPGKGPEFSCFVIAVDILALECRKSLSIVKLAAGNRRRFAMRVVHRWGEDGCRTPFEMRVDRLSSLDNAPAVVATFFDPVDELPKFPANIADIQVARLAVETEFPRVAKTKRPDFR